MPDETGAVRMSLSKSTARVAGSICVGMPSTSDEKKLRMSWDSVARHLNIMFVNMSYVWRWPRSLHVFAILLYAIVHRNFYALFINCLLIVLDNFTP